MGQRDPAGVLEQDLLDLVPGQRLTRFESPPSSAVWLEGLQITSEDGQAVISGPQPDHPALHGVQVKIRRRGPCLISDRPRNLDQAGKRNPAMRRHPRYGPQRHQQRPTRGELR